MDQGRAQVLDEGRAQVLDQGSVQNLGQGRAQAFVQGRDQVLDQGRAQILDQGRAQVLDEGRAQVLDQGRAQVLDEGRAQVLDQGREQVFEEEVKEDGDRFLPQAIKLKGESCSVGNFGSKLVQALFSPEELVDRNCAGKKGKQPLDPMKLDKVKNYVFRMYPVPSCQKEVQWKKCVVAIDEFLRRRSKNICMERQQ